MKRNEDSLTVLWDNFKCTNIFIVGVPYEEEREKGSQKIFEEIIAENFLNMGKEIVKSRKQSPRQDKPKEEHTKTYSNQIGKN